MKNIYFTDFTGTHGRMCVYGRYAPELVNRSIHLVTVTNFCWNCTVMLTLPMTPLINLPQGSGRRVCMMDFLYGHFKTRRCLLAWSILFGWEKKTFETRTTAKRWRIAKTKSIVRARLWRVGVCVSQGIVILAALSIKVAIVEPRERQFLRI